MVLPALMVLGVLLVSVVLVRRMEPPAEMPMGMGRWMYRSAATLVAVYALFWAAMGFGEMAGGISGGELHLFPAAAAAFLVFLAWRRPDVAAIVLLLLGAALTLFLLWILLGGWRPPVWWYIPLGLLLFGGPFLLAGFLLRLATRGSRGAGRPREGTA